MHTNNQLCVQVQSELEHMQPYVQSHGGEIELVSIEDYNVFVRLKGACDTCPLSFYTITFGLEQRLQKSINPAIRVIIQD
ncbi:MAG: NifU family protein [Candidatus Chromulinivorax sp.]|nr:NifU family protein [Candidatus Chromulinivorax sp.]